MANTATEMASNATTNNANRRMINLNYIPFLTQ